MPSAAPYSSPGVRQVVAILAAVLVVRHAPALRAPFFSDDYLFLDRLRGAPFDSVWSAGSLAYQWYRPWSRDLHYWAFARVFPLDPLPWHLASFALWLVVMALYWTLARRLAGARIATVAAAGLAALAAWGVPLEWAAGVQDLWMMTFALACLHLMARGRVAWAAAALALALLSKESAAVLPALAFAQAVLIEGRAPRAALLRIAPLAAVVAVWALAHPALGGRWWWSPPSAALPEVRGDPLLAAGRSLLALVNLDLVPRPLGGWGRALLVALPAALLLAWLAHRATRRAGPGAAEAGEPRGAAEPAVPFGSVELRAAEPPGASPAAAPTAAGARAVPPRPSRDPAPPAPPRRVAAFGAAWAAAGLLPLLAPSVLWQPYYALLGAFGGWLALAVPLARSQRAAVAAVLAVALLRGPRADTATRDWGNEWVMRFGRSFMARTEAYLRQRFPALPRHARLYFTGVPRGVVFVVARDRAPALRVWFADPTVRGGFWNDFRAREPGDSTGPDHFFRWDSTAGWIEVAAGPENVDSSRARNPRWREDHERLAWVLLNGGDVAGASREYGKLARAHPLSFDYAYLAGMSHEAVGDSAGAARWYRLATERPTTDGEALAKARGFGAGR